MVETQIEVKSVAFQMAFSNKHQQISLSKNIKFDQNAPCAVGEGHTISYFTKTIYVWFYWHLTNNEWSPPPTFKLVCPMDKYNFPHQTVPQCWNFNDDDISIMQ